MPVLFLRDITGSTTLSDLSSPGLPNRFRGVLESVVKDHIRQVVFALGFSQIAVAQLSFVYPDHGGPCD